MTVFKCNVVDQAGKKHKISHNAESKAEVIGYLKRNKYVIINIEQSAVTINLGNFSKKKIKSKDLSIFCKQLHAMLRAGVTLVNCLEILLQQTENKTLAKIVGQMYEDLQKGNTFSEALSHHKYAFPSLFINMVEAGEISGNIDVVMNRLSNHFEKEYKIENKIKSAMTYPIILALVCIAVVVFLMTTIMPTFVDMYSSSGVELPDLTKTLINISEVLKKYWCIILLTIVALAVGKSASNKIAKAKFKEDYYKLKLPVVNNLLLKVATTRFTRTLSTLIGSGLPLLQALDIVSGVTGNTYIGSKILEAKDDVRRGIALSQSLKQQGVFPPLVHNMIKIGEDSGSIEEILDKTADFYDEEVDTAVTRMTIMLEPLMIVFMATIIGFIVIAMVIPMFDMVKTVQ